MNPQRLIVIVGTAHKVGSVWLYDLVKDLCGLSLLPGTLVPFLKNPQISPVDVNLSEILPYLTRLEGRFILKSHSYPPPEPPQQSDGISIRFLTIIRDPRDVLVSASFYLAKLTDAQGGWGTEFRQMTAANRIITVIKKGDFLLSRLRQWHETPFAYKIRYEDLWNNPIGSLQGVANHLGFTFDLEAIERVVSMHSFQQKTGRRPGDEVKDHFYRKGIIGDWKNYFDPQCIAAFKKERDGEWNKILVEMGYEDSLDW